MSRKRNRTRQNQSSDPEHRPWTPHALADLSTVSRVNRTSVLHKQSAQGTISSQSRSAERPWITYEVQLKGILFPGGTLRARTSNHRFEYEISRKGTRITLNGAPFGSVQRDGTLLDASGQPIGTAKPKHGAPFSFGLPLYRLTFDEQYRTYPVLMGERSIGSLANPAYQVLRTFGPSRTPAGPIVTPADNLSDTEATRLLALAILQVAATAVRK